MFNAFLLFINDYNNHLYLKLKINKFFFRVYLIKRNFFHFLTEKFSQENHKLPLKMYLSKYIILFHQNVFDSCMLKYLASSAWRVERRLERFQNKNTYVSVVTILNDVI